MKRRVADLSPGPGKIFIVALDLRLCALGAGRADDQSHALGDIQILDHSAQSFSVSHGCDFTTDPATAVRIGHQHAVTSGQGKIGRQRSALVAALFLDHLNEHDLSAFDHLLNLVTPHHSATATSDFLVDLVVVVATQAFGIVLERLPAVARSVSHIIIVGLRVAHQRLAVRVRYLKIVRVDFIERQKSMAVAAVFDEGGL